MLLAVGGVVVVRELLPESDPIIGFIKRSHDQCRQTGCHTTSLIPEVFAGGEHRQEVEERLAGAGFGPHGDSVFVRRNADSVFLACDIHYYVTVEFDPENRLTKAAAQTGATCM